MSRRYAFNLAADRFDTAVMAAFGAGVARLVRDDLVERVYADGFAGQLLNAVEGLERVPAEMCRRAAVNVIDFHFEPIVLSSIRNDDQLHAYFRGFTKTLRVESVSGVEGGGPLWVETAHHACVFSVLYDLIAYLSQRHGYRRATLLHQGLRPEPRLSMVGNLLARRHGVTPRFIRLQDDWFGELARTATPDTVILYLSDVPPETSARTAPRKRTPARLALAAAPGLVAEVDTLAGGDTLARRLKARHVVLEYPGPDRLRVRPFDPDNPVLHMPVEDWVFWPLLKAA
jgi:hypothetical protein